MPPGSAGFSLLQRWASAPHALELSGNELTTYIATGKLPAHSLAQLQPSPANVSSSSSADDEKQEEKEYKQREENVLAEMKDYEAKLDRVRLKAESAYKKVSEQEKRLTANFAPVKKMLNGLIQKAVDTAAKAEVQTMLERLQRMHFKQIGTLDRSPTYWLEVAEREKEARRVAEAHSRLYDDKLQSLLSSGSQELYAARKAREEEKAELDEWFKSYWSQLEASEKAALQKGTPFDEDEQRDVIAMVNDYAASNSLPVEYEDVVSAAPELVPATPGEIIPNSA